jgi:NADH:ubiquinone oxidoreductase subunit 3 (subunit A)
MDPSPVVSAIAHQIQLSVAPVFLLAGVGAILNVLANRLARVVERARELAAALQSLDAGERARALGELQLLTRRIKAANLAIVCCTTSALFVCLVVATLFIAAPTQLAVARFISWLFIAAMAFLTAGLVLFLHEVRLAMRSINIRFPRGGAGPGAAA